MLTFPVALYDIKKFEKANNVTINVYGCTNYKLPDGEIAVDPDDARSEAEILEDSKLCHDLLDELECSSDSGDDDSHVVPQKPKKKKKNSIHPLKVVDVPLQKFDEDGNIIENRHLNLLLTESNEDQHYSTIMNFSRLAQSQTSKDGHKKFFCYRCLHGFTRLDLLSNHQELCQGNEPQREVLPYKDPILKFTNIRRQLKAPFAVYADAETILKTVESPVSTGVSKCQ